MIFKLHIGFLCSSKEYTCLQCEMQKFFSAKPLPFCKQNVISYISLKLAEKFKEDLPVLGKMTDSLLSPPEEELSETPRH